jgi:hypothetical protein
MLTVCNVVHKSLFLGWGLKSEVPGSQISLRRCAHAEETGFEHLVLWNMKLPWQEI